jgi:hypothetical protein
MGKIYRKMEGSGAASWWPWRWNVMAGGLGERDRRVNAP